MQISTEGGTQAIWAPTGRELFWRNGDKVMTAGVQANATFFYGEAHAALSAAYIRHWQGLPDWDINPDESASYDQGQRYGISANASERCTELVRRTEE